MEKDIEQVNELIVEVNNLKIFLTVLTETKEKGQELKI